MKLWLPPRDNASSACRVLMANGKWKVPKSERPNIRIPNDPIPEVTRRGPDYRRNLVAAKSGSKVVRA